MSLLLAQFVPVWAPPVLGWGRKIRAGARPAGMEGNPRRGRVLSLPFVPSPLCHLQGHPAGAKDSGDPNHSAVGNPLGIPSSSRENSAMGTGNRLELPPGAGGGRGGGGSRASIRSCSPEVAHGAGVTAGPWEGTSASGPDRSPGSARPRRRSGRDKIPTGMLEKNPERLGFRAWCFQRLRAVGMGDWGTGGVPRFQLDGISAPRTKCNSTIPQFQNSTISTVPQFHSSILGARTERGWCLHRSGNVSTGQKVFFPLSGVPGKAGKGAGEAPAAAGSSQPFILLARRNYISISQITPQLPLLPAPSPPRGVSARSTREPRGRKGCQRGMDPGGSRARLPGMGGWGQSRIFGAEGVSPPPLPEGLGDGNGAGRDPELALSILGEFWGC